MTPFLGYFSMFAYVVIFACAASASVFPISENWPRLHSLPWGMTFLLSGGGNFYLEFFVGSFFHENFFFNIFFKKNSAKKFFITL
jgi:hypothetical protein